MRLRELSGYHHPADPIGPEPAAAAPDLRAAWHEALAALGPVDGPDVRGMPDGILLHLRDTYPVETAWAPQWVGDELRQVRDAAWDARLTDLRAAAEADAARRPAIIRKSPGNRNEPAAIAPWRRPTGSVRPCSPRSWQTGRNGRPRPGSSGSWRWPPTPSCAAVTPASTSRHCGRPNLGPPPAPSAPSSR